MNVTTADGRLDYHVFVVCQNEIARIEGCLASIREAIGDRRALVTLNLNGSTDGSDKAARTAARVLGLDLRIYHTKAADKSNALNHFIHHQREPARLYAFVDGYVRISPTALHDLDASLAAHPHAMAATGVALNGRTQVAVAQRTLKQGGMLHGQLHAIRPDFLNRMMERGLRFPVGLYSGDGLMGSMAMYNLDALGKPHWDTSRIVAVPHATYEIASLSVLKPRDLQRQFRRKVRQMRGRLQNAAIKHIIFQSGYAGLPDNADEMVRTYLTTHPVPRQSMVDRPFMALALRQIRDAVRIDPFDLQPCYIKA